MEFSQVGNAYFEFLLLKERKTFVGNVLSGQGEEEIVIKLRNKRKPSLEDWTRGTFTYHSRVLWQRVLFFKKENNQFDNLCP